MNLLLRLSLFAVFVAATVLPAFLPASALDLQRRRMMTAAEQKPWKGVGRLDIKNRLGESMCTGTLIAEDLVLTAAHCVTSQLTGLAYMPEDVEFIAGERLGVSAGKSRAARIAVHPAYDAGRSSVGENIRFDLAVIRLAKRIPSARAPFFEVAPPPSADAALTLISYRRDRASGLTRQDGCGIDLIEDAVLTLGCEVTFGASGSSFFQDVDGMPKVVAVLSAMHSDKSRPTAFAVVVADALAPLIEALD